MMGRRVLLAAAVVALLAGCTQSPEPAPAPAPAPSVSSSAGSRPSPEAPAAFVPDGTAAENLAWFDNTNQALVGEQGDPLGPAFIDALVAAGFDRAAMELTADRTSVNLDADNIQFSVRIGPDCLVGQWGNVGYQSAILPVLDTGRCLVGATVPVG